MPLFEIGLTYQDANSDQLAALTQCGSELADRLVQDESGLFIGVVVLATCNRFEVYAHAANYHAAVQKVRDLVRESSPDADPKTVDAMSVRVGQAAVEHLFTVASGLDSMVIGEKEVAGQVKEALTAAGSNVSARLRRLFQVAATTSKRVATETELGAAGRSVASVGLDLVTDFCGLPERSRVLILGTGAFARVVVAELRRRGVDNIRVHSSVGRADEFASSHGLKPVAKDELNQALAWADAVICCSGSRAQRLGVQRLTAARTGCEDVLAILDLSLESDVDPEVSALPGVRIFSLDEVGSQAPAERANAVQAAYEIVNEGVAKYLSNERGRHADPTVTTVRHHFQKIIEAEIESAKQRYSAETAQAIAESLHRVNNELLHAPTVRATQHARNGDLESYQKALKTVFGLEVASAS